MSETVDAGPCARQGRALCRLDGLSIATCFGSAVLTLLFCCAQPAFGQGVVRDSVGATSSGRGGTNIAHSDNLNLILDNPAGLANLKESRRVDLGLDVLVTDLEYGDRLDHEDGDVIPFALPQFGYAQKVSDRLVLGLGFAAPAGFGARYQIEHSLYGEREYHSLGALVKILPAIAYRVTDRLSVGATFGLAISHVQLEAPYHLQTGFLAGVPAMIDVKATGLAPTWSVGAQYKLTEKTTVGLSYLAETRFRLDGSADADMSGFGFPLLKARYDAEVDIDWPASVGAGITHRFNEKHRTSFDVVWTGWKHAFDELDLKLRNGSNPLFNVVLGRKVHDELELDWNDALAFRIGHEFFFTPQDVLRVGYIYHNSPIPTGTLIPNLCGTLEHAVSVGYGHQWKKWRIDLAYQYSWSPTTHVGRSRLAGGDYDGSAFNAQAHWLFVGFSYRF